MKRQFLHILAAAVLVVGMTSSAFVKSEDDAIESGTFNVNKNTSGFNLGQGEGPREFTMEVTFAQEFASKPDILLSVTSVDANTKGNVRYKIETSFVSKQGFIVRFSTWDDSKIYGLSGQWMAITE